MCRIPLESCFKKSRFFNQKPYPCPILSFKYTQGQLYLKTFHEKWYNNISLLVCKLLADTQEHQHVVTPLNTHGVQVTQYVCTCNTTLNIGTCGYILFVINKQKILLLVEWLILTLWICDKRRRNHATFGCSGVFATIPYFASFKHLPAQCTKF